MTKVRWDLRQSDVLEYVQSIMHRLDGEVQDYKPLKILGTGGVAHVVEVKDRRGVSFALKVPRQDMLQRPEVLEVMMREARVMCELPRSSYLVQLVAKSASCLDTHTVPWLLMELLGVKGSTLEHVFSSRGPCPVRKAMAILEDVLRALQLVHHAGYFHRDLKAGNLLCIEGSGYDARFKLADFGLAKQRGTGQEYIDNCFTPATSAPEVLRREPIDESSDLYSAAQLFAELLRGQRLRVCGSTQEALEQAPQVCPMAVEWTKAVSPAAVEFVRKGLAYAPAERYRSAGEMLQALDLVRAAEACTIY